MHPLSTWTWEYCHGQPWGQWNYPTHVAALHDTVAVLTSGIIYGCPDVLFLSSTNLSSWTSIDLSYEYMSLTTYQSKLVLVGGRHPSTHEPTNQLLTSTTGQQWEPSLPPMPTTRYRTSSVSTRSPEVLVVAGGQGSNGKELDVVEVLQGDKWLMVDPLPVPAAGMRSTFYDGKICFMRRGRQDSTVFTCSCTPLISSCSKSSGNSSRDRPLWRQFQAPDESGFGTIASCFSRLVFINNWGRVRGYSSMTRSWLTTTSAGPTPDRAGTIAGTVLNTGELILAHRHGGIYRGAVSGEREH